MMMLSTTQSEESIGQEGASVAQARHTPAVFTICHNPFRTSIRRMSTKTKGSPPKATSAMPEENKTCGSPCGMSKEMPTTLPSVFFTTDQAEETKEPDEMCVPAVAFPYITGLDEELEQDIRLMGEQIQVLPCEIETLAADLSPPEPVARGSGSPKLLVVGLDGTLVAIHRKSHAAARVELRPLALDFLRAVSKEFEIIVLSRP